jgi:hypothetical protein
MRACLDVVVGKRGEEAVDELLQQEAIVLGVLDERREGRRSNHPLSHERSLRQPISSEHGTYAAS